MSDVQTPGIWVMSHCHMSGAAVLCNSTPGPGDGSLQYPMSDNDAIKTRVKLLFNDIMTIFTGALQVNSLWRYMDVQTNVDVFLDELFPVYLSNKLQSE